LSGPVRRATFFGVVRGRVRPGRPIETGRGGRKSGRARGGGGLCEALHICRIDGSDNPTIFSLACCGVAPFPPKAGPQKGARRRVPSGPRLAHPRAAVNPRPPRTARSEGLTRLRRSSRSSGQAICQCELLRTAFGLRLPRGRRRRGPGDAKNCPRRSAWPTRRRCRSPPPEAAGHERDRSSRSWISASSRQGRDWALKTTGPRPPEPKG